LYRPPVATGLLTPEAPPQTTNSVPVQIAVCTERASGTSTPVDVGAHVFVAGSYRPPVFRGIEPECPPQTIICLPVQTPEWL
jgi:hypothetical protein